MNNKIIGSINRELLRMFTENHFFTKMYAVHKIKCQPFFGKPSINEGLVTVKWNRINLT